MVTSKLEYSQWQKLPSNKFVTEVDAEHFNYLDIHIKNCNLGKTGLLKFLTLKRKREGKNYPMQGLMFSLL